MIDADEVIDGERTWDGRLDFPAALAAAQAGDEAAFELLFLDIQPRLLRYLRNLVRDDAEDVAAEVWEQITTHLRSFDGALTQFRGWTTAIARNRAIDHLRRKRRRPAAEVRLEELDALAGRDDAERQALDRISTDSVLALVAELPRDQAEAIVLRVVIGLDAKTAGIVLGKRPGAVRTAAYRGLRTLARKINASD